MVIYIHWFRLYDECHLCIVFPFDLCLNFVLLLFGSYLDMCNTIIHISIRNITTQQHQQQLRVCAFNPLIESSRLVLPPYLFLSLLTFKKIVVWLLFGYMQCNYLQKCQQYHNTVEATIVEGRCIQSIACVFTMSESYVILVFFISAYLLFYYCFDLIWMPSVPLKLDIWRNIYVRYIIAISQFPDN